MQELERAIRLELAAQLVRDVLDGTLDEETEIVLRQLQRELRREADGFRSICAPSRRQRSDAGTKRKPDGQRELMGS